MVSKDVVPTPLDEEIRALERTLEEARGKLRLLRQQRADLQSPFKIGQRLINKLGGVAEVTRIEPGHSSDIIIFGQYIDANGSLAAERILWERDNWKNE